MPESSVLKQQIAEIARITTELQQQKTELEFRIEELNRVKQALTRLLPRDERIERLFS